MNSSVDFFQDVHQHATSVHGWGQTYSQISAGALKSSLAQFSTQHSHVFRELINQRVVQHGCAPKDKICFAVPMAISGTARVQGREADDKCIFVLRGGDEFMFHMPMAMDILSITFDRGAFEDALTHFGPSGIDALLRQPVVHVSQQRLASSRLRLQALFNAAISVSEMGNSPGAEQLIEQEMMSELLGLISDPACDRLQRHRSSSRSYIVEKCHQWTITDASNAPSVVDMCKRLKVSRRTVQNSFQSVTETNPVNYIRCIRLNGVRRELMAASAAELSIGDAAARWGFYHLSHFASEYQELFQELPSQTWRPATTARSVPSPSA
jgi:AraC family transcriptional regulator, ethanolamine operon transcriptional activator